jgi:hypothetical protein
VLGSVHSRHVLHRQQRLEDLVAHCWSRVPDGALPYVTDVRHSHAKLVRVVVVLLGSDADVARCIEAPVPRQVVHASGNAVALSEVHEEMRGVHTCMQFRSDRVSVHSCMHGVDHCTVPCSIDISGVVQRVHACAWLLRLVATSHNSAAMQMINCAQEADTTGTTGAGAVAQRIVPCATAS